MLLMLAGVEQRCRCQAPQCPWLYQCVAMSVCAIPSTGEGCYGKSSCIKDRIAYCVILCLDAKYPSCQHVIQST